METPSRVTKDWRDSLVTKTIVLFGAAGALALGSLNVINYYEQKFCEEYGWLKNQPVAEQLAYANRTFNESPLGEELRDFHVRNLLTGIKYCE